MAYIANDLINEIEKIAHLSNENTNNAEKVVTLMQELNTASKGLETDIMKFKT